jgi:hypothetical protein
MYIINTLRTAAALASSSSIGWQLSMIVTSSLRLCLPGPAAAADCLQSFGCNKRVNRGLLSLIRLELTKLFSVRAAAAAVGLLRVTKIRAAKRMACQHLIKRVRPCCSTVNYIEGPDQH